MAINISPQYAAIISPYLAGKTLPVTERRLAFHKAADPVDIPVGRGLSYTATRFERFNLPQFPLLEGVPPQSRTQTFTQQTGTAQQWGDLFEWTDIAEKVTIFALLEQAKERIGLQISETLDRNVAQSTAMAGTHVNYVNSRNGRVNLVAGDVLDTFTLLRTVATLRDLGAPQFTGQSMTDEQMDLESAGSKAFNEPKSHGHYIAITHDFPAHDLLRDPTFGLAATFNDPNRLYNAEVGIWSGVHFLATNMCPYFIGAAQVTGTPGAVGNLATGTYYVVVTGSRIDTSYETIVCLVSPAITVTGPNGSIAVTVPATVGYTWNVYVGLTTSPTNLGVSVSGPTDGPFQGQATMLTGGSTVTITGVGVAQSPPAPPNTGLTVFPTFIVGKGAWAAVRLDDIEINMLLGPDKADPLNQRRQIGYKWLEGSMVLNQDFFARIESVSNFSTAFI